MKYRKVPVSSVVNIISGGTPKTSVANYWNGSIPWLSVKDFGEAGRTVYQAEKHITELGLKESSTNLLECGDIIISARGTVGELSIIGRRMAFNQSCFGLRVKEDIIPEYLYYALKFNLRHIKNSAHGSVFDTITLKDFDQITIELPELDDQRKIAKILSSLDEKIEFNNRTNDNLHELCLALYRDLISHLDESNSTKDLLKNHAKCVLGGTPSRNKPEYWGGSVNWINSGEINHFRILAPSETITELGLQKTSTALLPKKTTVLAITGATLGQVSRIEIETCANQSVIGIIPDDSLTNEFVYLNVLENITNIIGRQTGGAQQHINKNDVETYELLIPNIAELCTFSQKVTPIFEKIKNNCIENEKLTHLRDTLLPELMNGKIDLSKVEI